MSSNRFVKQSFLDLFILQKKHLTSDIFAYNLYWLNEIPYSMGFVLLNTR
jgi:hypothetical protein